MADSELTKLINLDTNQKIIDSEDARWDLLLSQKHWEHPFRYGELTIKGFKDAINRNHYSWSDNSLVYANLFKKMNASPDDIMAVTAQFVKNDVYYNNKTKNFYFEIYTNSLATINHPISIEEIANFYQRIPLRIDANNIDELLLLLKPLGTTPDEKQAIVKLLTTQVQTIFKNNLDYMKKYKIDDDDYHQRERSNPIYTHKGVCAKIDIYLSNFNTAEIIKLAKKLNEFTSLMYFAQTKKLKLSECISTIMTNNKKLFNNYELIEDMLNVFKHLERDEVIKEFKKLPEFIKYIKEYISSKPKGENNQTDLQIITLLEYAGIDTSDIQEKVINNREQDYVNVDYSNPILLDKDMSHILDMWIRLDFKRNSKLYELFKARPASEVISYFRRATWLSKELCENKKHIDNDQYVQYAAAISKEDKYWPQVMTIVLELIHKNNIKARTAIKTLKDLGYPTKGPVPQSLSDTDAFLYAITGSIPKGLRDTAKLLEIKVGGETFREMVTEHLKQIQNPTAHIIPDADMPEFEITV